MSFKVVNETGNTSSNTMSSNIKGSGQGEGIMHCYFGHSSINQLDHTRLALDFLDRKTVYS